MLESAAAAATAVRFPPINAVVLKPSASDDELTALKKKLNRQVTTLEKHKVAYERTAHYLLQQEQIRDEERSRQQSSAESERQRPHTAATREKVQDVHSAEAEERRLKQKLWRQQNTLEGRKHELAQQWANRLESEKVRQRKQNEEWKADARRPDPFKTMRPFTAPVRQSPPSLPPTQQLSHRSAVQEETRLSSQLKAAQDRLDAHTRVVKREYAKHGWLQQTVSRIAPSQRSTQLRSSVFSERETATLQRTRGDVAGLLTSLLGFVAKQADVERCQLSHNTSHWLANTLFPRGSGSCEVRNKSCIFHVSSKFPLRTDTDGYQEESKLTTEEGFGSPEPNTEASPSFPSLEALELAVDVLKAPGRGFQMLGSFLSSPSASITIAPFALSSAHTSVNSSAPFTSPSTSTSFRSGFAALDMLATLPSSEPCLLPLLLQLEEPDDILSP
eukprot:NODE_446_length_1664_cov_237.751703_g343_i0.p1 GENE.NODE_446_length_1664_cov_237.751703_g343_i0~~NODE_446_length_1664_cov_237.751703_g343_i0.p1  ORF type:complete len:446 (+),score=104.99 NODE_446_length_1664_cov_237.751703_g343_i0:250-1587(+)